MIRPRSSSTHPVYQRRPGHHRLVRLRLPLLVLALVAGCAGAPAPERPAPRLTATLEQSRNAENLHRVQVLLASDREVRVLRLQVRGGGFAEVPPTPRDDLVRPGRPVTFPVAYGAAACAGGPGPATVVVGTPEGDRALDVTDDPLLPRLHRQECAVARLAQAAGTAFEGWRREGASAVTTLVLRRRAGTEPVELTSLEANIVFDLAARTPLLLAGAGEVRVPVRVRAARCDAHALIENKRAFTFAAYARLAGGPPQHLTVTATGEGRALLDQLLRECGAAAMRSPAPAGAG